MYYLTIWDTGKQELSGSGPWEKGNNQVVKLHHIIAQAFCLEVISELWYVQTESESMTELKNKQARKQNILETWGG